ncbi:MAG: 30S ribosomal protein S18 [Bifidobacteriaceae bacterium]|jgi:small subunit ribosomal protein S18|nr:30S ribosomal protein S18 [Bifidobacteriaceae bacterium]
MARKIVKKKKYERPGKKVEVRDDAAIDYKNVAFLQEFISDRGKIRPRSMTGVNVQQQKKVANAIKNAREMALLPYVILGRNFRRRRGDH